MILRTFRTANFTVTVETERDHCIDLSWDETGEVRKKLDSGEFEHFGVKASVEYEGIELATDYLGGCIHADPREFQDHKGMNARGHGSYFSDMVRNVCAEARHEMARLKLKTQSVSLR